MMDYGDGAPLQALRSLANGATIAPLHGAQPPSGQYSRPHMGASTPTKLKRGGT
jgi:hypothetical protein